jgi:hypothetical protein
MARQKNSRKASALPSSAGPSRLRRLNLWGASHDSAFGDRVADFLNAESGAVGFAVQESMQFPKGSLGLLRCQLGSSIW